VAESPEATKSGTYRSEYRDRLVEEGALRQARSTLIRILELTPGGGITAEHRQRIEAVTDLQEIEEWLDVIFRIRNWNAPAQE
jgi:hypothetical protein